MMSADFSDPSKQPALTQPGMPNESLPDEASLVAQLMQQFVHVWPESRGQAQMPSEQTMAEPTVPAPQSWPPGLEGITPRLMQNSPGIPAAPAADPLTNRAPQSEQHYFLSPEAFASNGLYFLPQETTAGDSPQVLETFDVAQIRRDFPMLQRTVNGKPLTWLDNAATTQKPRQVIEALTRFYTYDNSNIHRGAHTLANLATTAYEEARTKVQGFLGAASPQEIIFVRGTTEGINLVAQTYGRANVQAGDEILITTLEHHSNIVPWQMLCEEKGAQLRVVPLNGRGEIVLAEYSRLLGPRTRLVALSHVSNVLGTVLPLKEMIALAHQAGVHVLVDGAQAVPHLQTNVQELDADFYTFSGHKLFGPTGIGVLYGKLDLLESMPPWQGGGSMIEQVTFEKTTYSAVPAKFEAGTAHIAGVIGLGAAIDYLQQIDFAKATRYEERLMDYARQALATVPGLHPIGSAPDKVGVLTFILDGHESQEVGESLNKQGIALRAGHHCAQPTLAHFGLTSAIRPSLAFYNTREEIDRLVNLLQNCQKRS